MQEARNTYSTIGEICGTFQLLSEYCDRGNERSEGNFDLELLSAAELRFE
jgi:hypothetical protein